jgi:hypothetical protein
MDNDLAHSTPDVPMPVFISTDADELRKIRLEQDRARAELGLRIGTVNIAVELIRSIRDE